jgi:hypothetical protein
MTKKRTLKLLENLASDLEKSKGMEDASSILYVLAGTIALENEDALHSLCMHNVVWADQTLKAIQSHQKDGGTPRPENKIILPGEE